MRAILTGLLLCSVAFGQKPGIAGSSGGSGGGGGGSGTVTVVGSGNLTNTAIVTGGGSQTVQTPSATTTLDSSGNVVTPGTITTGNGAGTSGKFTFNGGTSGSAAVSVPLVAGTPNDIYLPTTTGTSGYVLSTNGANPQQTSWIPLTHAIGVTFDGGGSALSSGVTNYLTVPFACTIRAWNMALAPSGTATVDIWKIATGTAIPTVTNTITASALPAISSNTANRSTTLTSWTTSVAANDIFGFNLSAVATATQVNIILECAQ